MARLFRTQVAKSLEDSDAMKFQEIIKKKLTESYLKQQKGIIRHLVEQEDSEMQMVSEIESAARSYGGHGIIYDQGLLGIFVPKGKSSEGFADYLSKNQNVLTFEQNDLDIPVTSESATDLEGGDGRDEVSFTIELNPDAVDSFVGHMDLEESCKSNKKPIDEEEDDEEEDDEESDDEESDDAEDDEEESDDEDDEDEEEDDEDDEDMNESTHRALMTRFNNFVESIPPIETIVKNSKFDSLNEVSKVVAFRHVGQGSEIKKMLKLPPRPGFKIVDGGYVRLTAQAKRNLVKGQIAGARKRALTQKKAEKRRAASMQKRQAAGY